MARSAATRRPRRHRGPRSGLTLASATTGATRRGDRRLGRGRIRRERPHGEGASSPTDPPRRGRPNGGGAAPNGSPDLRLRRRPAAARTRVTPTRRSRGREEGRWCPGGSQAHHGDAGAGGEAGEGWRRRRLSSAAVGGGEEAGDARVDSELPGPIAGARRKREMRRSSWPASICSGGSPTSAASGGARLCLGHRLV